MVASRPAPSLVVAWWRRHLRAPGIAVLPALLLLAAPARAETRTELSFLASYLSGDFATGGDVHVIALPAVFAVMSERHALRLSLPYLYITSDQGITYLGDQVIQRPGASGGTHSGPGDFLVEGESFLVMGGSTRPWVSILLNLKLPTADESDGLGSGEVDAGGGFGLIQPLGDRWRLMAQARYLARGDPPDFDYRNTLGMSIGLQRRVSDSGSASLVYDRRQSVDRDLPAIAEFILGYERGLARRVNLKIGLQMGTTETAEDYGVSAGFSVH